MKLSLPFTLASLLLSYVSASPLAAPAPAPVPQQAPPPAQAKGRTIYQFPNGTGLENIAVRSNGHLLVNQLSPTAALYELDPYSPRPSPRLVAQIDGATTLLGITEIAPDVFAFISAIFTLEGGFDEGSSIVWRLDFRTRATRPTLSKIAAVPEAGFLNGMTSIPRPRGCAGNEALLAIADSPGGVVYLLDPTTGEYAEVLRDDATMSPLPGAPLPIGVNGVRYDAKAETLYYTNSFRALFARVRVEVKAPKSGRGLPSVTPKGGFEVVASDVVADDFALAYGRNGKAKRAYVTANPINLVWNIGVEDGDVSVLAGNLNSTEVAGCTSAAFGRGKKGELTNELFVVTSGAALAPVNGTYIEGGKVVSIKV